MQNNRTFSPDKNFKNSLASFTCSDVGPSTKSTHGQAAFD